MNTTRICSILALVCVSALVGCNNKPTTDQLTSENETLRKQLDDRNAALEAAERERLAAVTRADDAEAKLKAGGGSLSSSGNDKNFAGIEGVTTSRVGNELHVSIEGDVLFDSGKATLKDSSKKSLDKVAAKLKEKYSGKLIRVAGFTDTDPIKKSAFKNNYYLGFDRAYAVREYIIGKGLDGKDISLSSFGPDAPLKTKALSRRVEVIVVDG
ncbi:MAG: OmpA family protein [Planctomycetes bacterium]|nr:OmpA family protein [Planctomycetota bacterium]